MGNDHDHHDPNFLTLHALRIKGFAKVEHLADIADLDDAHIVEHLEKHQAEGRTVFREARELWQLTPDGKDHHAELLAAHLEAHGVKHELAEPYAEFLELNAEFKQLCTDWQMKGDQPNDHTDEAYDQGVLDRLGDINARAVPVVRRIGEAVPRFAPYARRLDQTCELVLGGDTSKFTGVMNGSYHDVWMELHEDLILSQEIDRAAEGSF